MTSSKAIISQDMKFKICFFPCYWKPPSVTSIFIVIFWLSLCMKSSFLPNHNISSLNFHFNFLKHPFLYLYFCIRVLKFRVAIKWSFHLKRSFFTRLKALFLIEDVMDWNVRDPLFPRFSCHWYFRNHWIPRAYFLALRPFH